MTSTTPDKPKRRAISLIALIFDVAVAGTLVTADLPFLVGGDISYVAWMLTIALPATLVGIVITIVAGLFRGINRVFALLGGAILLVPLVLEVLAQTVGI